MNKKWRLNETNDELVEKISKEFNISKLVSSIIVDKGLKEKEEIEIFLNPKRNNFHDPFLMPDMEKAVNRILKAMENKEKIAIYGDYDVDGITSSTVLKRFFKDRGIIVDVYIPNRLFEGYGLNEDAIREISNTGHTLIITVDCGITGNKEIELAKSLGIDTIVTDHHEQSETIPDCVAVVDCKRKDNTYPFNALAGVGVAFKLTQALSIKLGLKEEEYLKYLDIVCVGTISDIVPLVDENRTISKLGLKLLKQTKNVGLKALLEGIGYKKIDSIAVSFGIAPRINACGRMGHEKVALDLFLTDDINEARMLAEQLNDYNKERQDIEKRIFKEVELKMQNPEEQKLPCIILSGTNWHHGVIGIVSSKITEMYFKPSILLCIEDDIAKGSGRSIPGFDLHEALEQNKQYLEQYGGHSMAIGLKIKKENLEEFKKSLEEYSINKKISDIIPEININQRVQLQEVNMKDIKELEFLEPFGEANKVPLFQISNLKIASIRAISEGKHLKLTLKDENKFIDAVGFNMGKISEEYPIGAKVDVVGSLEINSYRDLEKIQINLKDIRHSL